MKQKLHIMRSMALLFCLFVLSAGSLISNAQTLEYEGLRYKVLDETAKTCEVTGPVDANLTGELVIPSTVSYNGATYNVVSIGREAFFSLSGFTSLVIREGITEIKDAAFRFCSDLTGSLILPEGLTTIGTNAFMGTSFDGVLDLPGSLESIIKFDASSFSKVIERRTVPPASCEFSRDVYQNAILAVPYGCVDAYRNASGWSNFKNIDDSEFVPKASIAIPLSLGHSIKFTFNVTPETSSDKSVIWSSSDEAVATVEADGTIRAKGVGSATIIATEDGDPNISASCMVTVSMTPAENITLSVSSLQLESGGVANIAATVTPEYASDKSVSWSSSDKTIATVDANGSVTAIEPGTATIVATTANGLTATCDVTVKSKVIAATSIALNVNKAELVEGTTTQLIATVSPDNATNKSVSWASSNEEVATVDAEGKVSAVSAGSAVIIAVSSNGMIATCSITVKAKIINAESIALNIDKAELIEGATTQLIATISPDNVTNKSITWTSSDEAIAKVDANGLVTAIAAGSATITATTANGLTATSVVTVKAKAIEITSIALNMDNAELIEGLTAQLMTTLSPENATDKSVTWRSSDEAVATVSTNGLVTAIAAGSATITATTSNGLTATCTVIVKAKQSGIEGVDGESVGVRVEGNAIIAPEGTKVYDLNGREVAPNSLAHGVYIVNIPGGKAVKVKV